MKGTTHLKYHQLPLPQSQFEARRDKHAGGGEGPEKAGKGGGRGFCATENAFNSHISFFIFFLILFF